MNVQLSEKQRENLTELRRIGGWCAQHDHHHLNGHSLNALVRKGIVESRKRPGAPSITEFRIRTEHL